MRLNRLLVVLFFKQPISLASWIEPTQFIPSSYYFRRCIVGEKLLRISFLQTISMESAIMSATHTPKCNPVDNGEKVHFFFHLLRVRPYKRQIGQCISFSQMKKTVHQWTHFISLSEWNITRQIRFFLFPNFFFFWLSQFRECFPLNGIRYPNWCGEWVNDLGE